MWIQKQINISQRSFLFSILVHALLLSFILKSALYIKIDTPKEMKVVLIPLPQASQSHKEGDLMAETLPTWMKKFPPNYQIQIGRAHV